MTEEDSSVPVISPSKGLPGLKGRNELLFTNLMVICSAVRPLQPRKGGTQPI